uniref:Uncharacterized protein n=1 Tax=Arundo donax TaxID=35708 RepID=A0A0A8YF68_ARUDO
MPRSHDAVRNCNSSTTTSVNVFTATLASPTTNMMLGIDMFYDVLGITMFPDKVSLGGCDFDIREL